MIRAFSALLMTVFMAAPVVAADQTRPPPACLCAQACQMRGMVLRAPADAQRRPADLSQCGPIRDELIYDNWARCACSGRSGRVGSSPNPAPYDPTSPSR